MTHAEIGALLKKEMVPALGCTGPTAYALATACCRPFFTAKPRQVDIYVSPAFLKIGFGVATPGTSKPGIPVAAAIGLVGGDYRLGLQVLKPCTARDVEEALALEASGIFRVCAESGKTGVYVRAEVTTDNEKVIAVVEHTHDGVSLIQVNDEVKYHSEATQEASIEDDPAQLSLEDIFSYVKAADPEDLTFLWDAYRMNVALAEDGIKRGFGLATGRAFLQEWWNGRQAPADLYENPLAYLPDGIAERAKILVAGASDARMGGSRLPAVAAMGDGNQGITATIPVGVAAELMGKGREESVRALALSCLMLFYIKMKIGRVAAFCLCSIASAAGVSAGVGFLKGMSEQQIKAAVKNVVSPLCGMLCDGAKNACALKMAIATTTALSCVDLAANDVECGFYDGVADETLEYTVGCISQIATRSMSMLDECMVDEIVKKTERKRLESLDPNV